MFIFVSPLHRTATVLTKLRCQLYTMGQITYPNNSLSNIKLDKNDQAVKCLEALGFNVLPCRIGGEGEFAGGIVYFTASTLPIRNEDNIVKKD